MASIQVIRDPLQKLGCSWWGLVLGRGASSPMKSFYSLVSSVFIFSQSPQLVISSAEILHQLIGIFPIIYRVSYIPGGAGFQPSTVGHSFWITSYPRNRINKKLQTLRWISRDTRPGKVFFRGTACGKVFDKHIILLHRFWRPNCRLVTPNGGEK